MVSTAASNRRWSSARLDYYRSTSSCIGTASPTQLACDARKVHSPASMHSAYAIQTRAIRPQRHSRKEQPGYGTVMVNEDSDKDRALQILRAQGFEVVDV